MPQAGALRVDPPQCIVPLRTGPAGRHLVDITLLFAPTSGGVRRYLLAKHEWLTRRSRLKHTFSLLGRRAGRAAGRYLADLYARFDLVLAPSNVVAERLSGIGVRSVEVRTLGVDVDTFRPGARDVELRAVLGIPREVRLLVFAGRLSPEEHVGDLVAAIRLLGPRYHLLLIGSERFAPRAPDDLARTVMAQFDRNRTAVGRAARTRAEAHGWDAAFTRLLGRYSKLMARQAAPQPQLRRVR